jgi:hypothetical protein
MINLKGTKLKEEANDRQDYIKLEAVFNPMRAATGVGYALVDQAV